MSATHPMRTLLFVPATHIERIPKAINSGADAVVVDWEDAVAFGQKETARHETLAYLKNTPNVKVWIRINAHNTTQHALDVMACQQSKGILGILLPKAEQASVISDLNQHTQKPIIALIETPLGLLHLPQIAAASGLQQLSFGALDLAQMLGATPNTSGGDQLMHQVRFQLLLHSKINALEPPIDTVYPDFKDSTGLALRIALWQQMGFSGMLCIHPQQVKVVHEQLIPSTALQHWAEAVIKKATETGLLAFQLNGQMIDAPVIAQAQHILNLSQS